MLRIARRLAELGVMGINRRNAAYTLVHNPRHLYPLVDNKLRTKSIAAQAGIPTPALYGVIETENQVRDLAALLAGHQDFVIKPAHGSGGDGILVISGQVKGKYRKVSGALIDQEELNYQVFSILSGLYSLAGQPDHALVEYRVRPAADLEGLSHQEGVPDIRIIVFLGVPAMAMLRLPTRMSEGKANLHQGALGVGLDLGTGLSRSGVWRQELVTEHPDTGLELRGMQIPHWETLLGLAARCYELFHLGYLGVDIVLDRDHGPLLLELNARPGLAIQLANQGGLLPRLHLIEQHHQFLKSVEERVAFAQRRFAS